MSAVCLLCVCVCDVCIRHVLSVLSVLSHVCCVCVSCVLCHVCHVHMICVCRLCVPSCVHVMRVMFMCVSCVCCVCERVVAGCTPAAPSWSAGGTSVLSGRPPHSPLLCPPPGPCWLCPQPDAVLKAFLCFSGISLNIVTNTEILLEKHMAESGTPLASRRGDQLDRCSYFGHLGSVGAVLSSVPCPPAPQAPGDPLSPRSRVAGARWSPGGGRPVLPGGGLG